MGARRKEKKKIDKWRGGGSSSGSRASSRFRYERWWEKPRTGLGEQIDTSADVWLGRESYLPGVYVSKEPIASGEKTLVSRIRQEV